MTKQTTKREGAPAPVAAAPWVQPDAPAIPEFAPPIPQVTDEQTEDVAALMARLDQNAQETSGIEVPIPITSPFAEKISTNPFKATPVPKAAEVLEYEVKDHHPTWLEFVRFVQKYGDKIVQARYPKPMGTIDTIWRGVQVFPHPEAEVRHITEGWVSWEVANAP